MVNSLLRAPRLPDVTPEKPDPPVSHAVLSLEQQMMRAAIDDWGLAWWAPVPVATRIHGSFAPELLASAAAQLVSCQPIARGRLQCAGPDATQLLADEASSFAYEDLRDANSAELAARLRELTERPFDLAGSGPLRIAALRVADQTIVLALVGHHLFIDLPSMRALLHDYLDLLSRPRLPDRSAPGARDPAPPTQWDYARRQAQLVEQGCFERPLRYWAAELEGADPELAEVASRHSDGGMGLVEGTSRQSDGDAPGASFLPFALTDADSARLVAHARGRGVTPFALVAAASYAALRRLGGADDQLFAVVTSTRRGPFARTLGQFADLFFLRQRGIDRPLGDAHLQAVRRATLTGMARYVPSVLLTSRLACFAQRRTQRRVPCAVVLNYAPAGADDGWPGMTARTAAAIGVSEQPRVMVSEQPLPSLAGTPEQFGGMRLFILFATERPSLAGGLQFDPSAVDRAWATALAAELSACLTEIGAASA